MTTEQSQIAARYEAAAAQANAAAAIIVSKARVKYLAAQIEAEKAGIAILKGHGFDGTAL